MKRFKLTIAYDGAAYYGWQVQPRQVTVQQRVEEAVRPLCHSLLLMLAVLVLVGLVLLICLFLRP